MAFAKSLCAVFTMAALAACGSKSKEEKKPAAEPSEESSGSSGGGAAGLLGPAGALAMGSMFAEATKPGIYDAPFDQLIDVVDLH